MSERTILHIVDADTRVCAQVARVAFELGHHAEVYAGLGEFSDRAPEHGMALVRDTGQYRYFTSVRELLERCGVWVPVVAMGEDPDIERVVGAIKSGALDYLTLPVEPYRLAKMIAAIGGEAREHADAARELIEARNRLGALSAREREVLDWLAQGSSNKAIAKELQISPRTVEIHRANMMSKLGAHHPAEVIRLRLEAKLDRLAG